MNRRYWLMFRLLFIFCPIKRAKFMKAKGVFRKCGENVMIISRKIPLYSRLISIGNNVKIASNVGFATHDGIHFMLNNLFDKNEMCFEENVGCIEIGNNVFIGAGSKILYNVKIGNNVIVGANTLINKDIPDNTVVAGVPSRILGSFEDFVEKRKKVCYVHKVDNKQQNVSYECENELWENFYKIRKMGRD